MKPKKRRMQLKIKRKKRNKKRKLIALIKTLKNQIGG